MDPLDIPSALKDLTAEEINRMLDEYPDSDENLESFAIPPPPKPLVQPVRFSSPVLSGNVTSATINDYLRCVDFIDRVYTIDHNDSQLKSSCLNDLQIYTRNIKLIKKQLTLTIDTYKPMIVQSHDVQQKMRKSKHFYIWNLINSFHTLTANVDRYILQASSFLETCDRRLEECEKAMKRFDESNPSVPPSVHSKDQTENSICAICHDEFDSSNPSDQICLVIPKMELPCCHQFLHISCVLEIVNHNGKESPFYCPLCKRELPGLLESMNIKEKPKENATSSDLIHNFPSLNINENMSDVSVNNILYHHRVHNPPRKLAPTVDAGQFYNETLVTTTTTTEIEETSVKRRRLTFPTPNSTPILNRSVSSDLESSVPPKPTPDKIREKKTKSKLRNNTVVKVKTETTKESAPEKPWNRVLKYEIE